tara:strand:- start:1 stop:192 length:192 start_codon:yes stop_codon:yes gene_type:complete
MKARQTIFSKNTDCVHCKAKETHWCEPMAHLKLLCFEYAEQHPYVHAKRHAIPFSLEQSALHG